MKLLKYFVLQLKHLKCCLSQPKRFKCFMFQLKLSKWVSEQFSHLNHCVRNKLIFPISQVFLSSLENSFQIVEVMSWMFPEKIKRRKAGRGEGLMTQKMTFSSQTKKKKCCKKTRHHHIQRFPSRPNSRNELKKLHKVGNKRTKNKGLFFKNELKIIFEKKSFYLHSKLVSQQEIVLVGVCLRKWVSQWPSILKLSVSIANYLRIWVSY